MLPSNCHKRENKNQQEIGDEEDEEDGQGRQETVSVFVFHIKALIIQRPQSLSNPG